MPLPTIVSATVTITIASPAVISWAGHGLTAGTPVNFTTTGALPTGLVADGSAGSMFYVSSAGLHTNDFQVSTTRANADAGVSLNTSGSQSGTHTCSVSTGLFPRDSIDHAVTFPTSGPNITWNSHGLGVNDIVAFKYTAAPTGITSQDYYRVFSVVDANTIQISKNNPLLQGTTALTFSSAGSGTYGGLVRKSEMSSAALKCATVILAVPIVIENVVVGSQVRVADGSNNELYNATAATSTVSFTYKFAGTAYLTVRKAGYREFTTPFIVTSGVGGNTYVNQSVDGTA